ncbi:MAG: ATP-binding protein, partial [Cetobacterium sp.]
IENIIGDSRILKLVLNNLIQNALKYSIIGGNVKIFQNLNYLIIENIFQGELGNEMEKLLQPFSRGKNAEDFKFDGMGLGLSIISKALNLASIKYEIKVDQNKFIVKLKILDN